MEGILEEIRSHYFVDFSRSEIDDIVNATKTLLYRYLSVLNKRSQYFFVQDIEMAGSMAEKTRIWSFDSASSRRYSIGNVKRFPVIEFDFLARLAIGEDLDKQTLESCNGHMNIFKICDRGRRFSFHESRGIFLSPSDVRQQFQHELLNAINTTCNCNSVFRIYYGIEYIEQKKKKGCPKCKVEMKRGALTIASEAEFGNSYVKHCDLILKWSSTFCSLLAKDIEGSPDEEIPANEICVLVDFLPSYGLHESEYLLSETGSRSLIPKVCNTCEQKICWRISNSREETKMIQEISEHHRSVFMALKVFVLLTFRKFDDVHNPVSSYIIKTAFLHHISICYDEHVTTLDCFRNIFDLLSISFQNRRLYNLFTNHNLLGKYMHCDETFFQEYSTCFEIIKHVVLLADLLGNNNCCINVVYPYLRNANAMYRTLLKKKESLGDLQKYISKIQAERVRVADVVDSMQPEVSKLEKRRYRLREGDLPDLETSQPVDSVSINSTNDYSAMKMGRGALDADNDIENAARRSSGIDLSAPEIIEMKEKRFEETHLGELSKYRQKNDVNEVIRKDHLRHQNGNMSQNWAMDIKGKSFGLHRTYIFNKGKINMTDKPFGQFQGNLKKTIKKEKKKKKKKQKEDYKETVASYLCNLM